MDLTKEFPRPGWEKLGGYPWLPRAIDKCRAAIAGKLGDYIFPCPIDRELFSELDVITQEFTQAVASAETDEEVLEALGRPKEEEREAVKRWAREFLENRHDSLKRQAEEEGIAWSEAIIHPA
jgi:hypothetical protein